VYIGFVATGVAAAVLVSPLSAEAIGPVNIRLTNPTYAQYTCPPKTQVRTYNTTMCIACYITALDALRVHECLLQHSKYSPSSSTMHHSTAHHIGQCSCMAVVHLLIVSLMHIVCTALFAPTQIPGQKAGAGLRPVCVKVTAQADNPSKKVLS
jgi:hypothetical protein